MTYGLILVVILATSTSSLAKLRSRGPISDVKLVCKVIDDDSRIRESINIDDYLSKFDRNRDVIIKYVENHPDVLQKYLDIEKLISSHGGSKSAYPLGVPSGVANRIASEDPFASPGSKHNPPPINRIFTSKAKSERFKRIDFPRKEGKIITNDRDIEPTVNPLEALQERNEKLELQDMGDGEYSKQLEDGEAIDEILKSLNIGNNDLRLSRIDKKKLPQRTRLNKLKKSSVLRDMESISDKDSIRGNPKIGNFNDSEKSIDESADEEDVDDNSSKSTDGSQKNNKKVTGYRERNINSNVNVNSINEEKSDVKPELRHFRFRIGNRPAPGRSSMPRLVKEVVGTIAGSISAEHDSRDESRRSFHTPEQNNNVRTNSIDDSEVENSDANPNRKSHNIVMKKHTGYNPFSRSMNRNVNENRNEVRSQTAHRHPHAHRRRPAERVKVNEKAAHTLLVEDQKNSQSGEEVAVNRQGDFMFPDGGFGMIM